MEGKKCFAVVGGDARQAAAARALARAGYSVGGPEMIAVADYILLPLPLDAARTPLAELLRAARPGTLALGGMLSAEAKAIAAEAGVELVDYFAREELAVANAGPTALPIGHKIRPQGCPPSRREMLAAVSLPSRVMDMSSSSMRKVGPAMLTAAWMVWPMPKMGAPTQMSPGSISPSSMA